MSRVIRETPIKVYRRILGQGNLSFANRELATRASVLVAESSGPVMKINPIDACLARRQIDVHRGGARLVGARPIGW